MLNIIMLNGIMLNGIMLHAIMLYVIVLGVVTLNVIMLSVVKLSVVVPKCFLQKNVDQSQRQATGKMDNNFFYKNVLPMSLVRAMDYKSFATR